MASSNEQDNDVEDMDKVVAKHYGRKKIGGVVYTIVPVSALTQRYARELRAQMAREENPLQLTPGELTAKLAVRCLDPAPTEEQADKMSIAVLEKVLTIASQGLDELEKNGDGGPTPPTSPTPTTL